MPLLPLLFILFLVVPIAEIYLLIQVGQRIGALPTVGLVVATAVLGAALLRQQGLSTLMQARRMMDRGELPAIPLLEGLFLVFGGALLLTPGFVTDGVGFLCLVPAVRRWVIRQVIEHGRWVFVSTSHSEERPGHRVIEGDYRREE
ncbi:MAG: membrane protein FxsA [Gammaproteobacteria bacterium]